MILLQSPSKYMLQILTTRLQNLDKGVELDCHWNEFGDVRYHIQGSMKNPNLLFLSVSLPAPPPETVSIGGLPPGAIDAIKSAYGAVAQILDPPRDGFSLTLKLNFSKLPPDEEEKHMSLLKIASVRELVLGAPLRVFLKHLGSRTAASDLDKIVALVHRPMESFFLIPQVDKATVVFPMRFKDSTDVVLATSFLQEFVDARRSAGLSNAPLCSWSTTPPQELKEVPSEALSANAGYVSFVIFPRHVEGRRLDRTVWSLSTFHAFVSYHVKCSEGFMHTRMRRRVESLIQVLDRARPDSEESKKSIKNRSFKRLSEGRSEQFQIIYFKVLEPFSELLLLVDSVYRKCTCKLYLIGLRFSLSTSHSSRSWIGSLLSFEMKSQQNGGKSSISSENSDKTTKTNKENTAALYRNEVDRGLDQ
ncbi:OLC1v1025573C1 [Oldenlandia corymbosa var. corymbosa]|uniref:Arp2/3 complex 34 kDa subunit n=1 Tax=Oldenlandia corymbosa var. corymbosa TaxID=529605 RepID=A0AAV1C594_OLDCO|nr:OLC1v1025573C1 [Oldenlandia corymbosa var. corymbosa]